MSREIVNGKSIIHKPQQKGDVKQKVKHNFKKEASGLLSGTLSLTLSAIAVKFIGLVYKIPISAILGDEGMGYFNSAYTVFAFFYLLCTAGVPKAIMLMITESDAKKSDFSKNRILSVAIKSFLAFGGICSLILLIFSGLISYLIGSRGALFTLMAISPAVVILSVSGVLRGYLSARMKLQDISISSLIEGCGKLGFGLIFAGVGVRLGLPVQVLSSLAILGVVAGSIFSFAYLFVIYKIENKAENTGQSNKKGDFMIILKKILSVSLPITIGAAVMNITSILDLGIIMRSLKSIGYTESYSTALYGNYTTLAVPMFNLALTVISPLTVAFFPPLRNAFLTENAERIKRIETSLFELSSFLSAPMLLGLFVYSEEILSMLFKNSQTEEGSNLLRLLTPAIFFASLLGVVNTTLEASGKIKAPLISMAIGSFIKIPISVFLITKTPLGIGGAAVSSVVCYAIALMVSLIIYGMDFKKKAPIFISSILPYLCAFISVMISKIAYGRLKILIQKVPALILSISICALIYLAISLLCGIISRKKLTEIAKYTKFDE